MKNQAFTLVEVLVVVLIIGILAAIAVPQYHKSVEISKASQVYTMLDNIAKAELAYFLLHNTHTSKLSDLNIEVPFKIETRNQYYQNVGFYWRICNDENCMYAGRNYGGGFYFLQVDFNTKKFVCAAKQDTKANEICAALGFTEKYTSSTTTTWIDSNRNNTDYFKKPEE